MIFLIHAVKEREFNVIKIARELSRQGAAGDDINISTDFGHRGNLAATLNRYIWLATKYDPSIDIWHLQDDIVPSKDFMAIARGANDYADIVCGFCSTYCIDLDGNPLPPGPVFPSKMWLSFPCIKIPVHITTEFVAWIMEHADDDGITGAHIRSGKRDDELFKTFLEEKHSNMSVCNLSPNIVDHRDDLCGGSIVSPQRLHCPRALYFKG